MASVILSGTPATIPNEAVAAVTSVVAGLGIAVDNTSPEAPVVSTNYAGDSADRQTSVSLDGSAQLTAPNQVIATFTSDNWADLFTMLQNTKYNVCEIYAQFGLETTADVPRLVVGFDITPNNGFAYVCGDVCVASAKPTAPATLDAPSEAAFVIKANLMRGVHFSATTTSFTVSVSGTSTVSGAEITLIQDDSLPAVNPIKWWATMFV
jgi:hypothetical protein